MDFNVEDIEDEFIANVKQYIPEFNTVDVREPLILESEVVALLGRTPFCYIHSLDLVPVEEARMQNGLVTLADQDFMFMVGARSLRSKKEGQRGAYDLLRKLRTTFESNTFTIGGQTTGIIVYKGYQYEFTHQGLVVYSTVFGITQK
ncbi:MAG: hypothetical protein EPO24_04095 [Bacteroidetes bacterium]|nr:MAG: hypothetical protein EPO24_04095 [Bacteroidota bacterium]